MSKTVFFGLSGGLGPLLRCLPIAEKFRDAGHDVVFSMYGASGISLIRRLGFEHWPDDDPTLPALEKTVPPGSVFYDLDHYYAQLGLLDARFAEAWVRHRIGLLEEAQADLVFADMSPQSVIAARFLGLPVVSVTQACFHPRGERMYAWGQPPRNLPKVTPVINRLLDDLLLPPIRRMEELSAGDLDIVPGIEEMDPIDDPNVLYTGPMGAPQRGLPEPASMAELTADGLPFVLVYPGRLRDTSGDSGLGLLRQVYGAFAGRPVSVVIASGELPEAELLPPPTPNIRLIPYFTERLLDGCALFIHHGGHGSCLSAIAAGVPSLIVPTQTEREYNARRMQRLGTAEYVLPGAFTPEHLYRLSRYVMDDDYRERTGRLRLELLRRGYGGAQAAYERSLRLLGGKTRK